MFVWSGVPTLRVEFSNSSIDAEADSRAVLLSVDGTTHELSREAARELAEEVGEALVFREEFLRTAGEHRPDGSYVVSRRGADSAGNEKVFNSFRRLERLYERLPGTFDADDVGRTGITGSRRHMVVRHLAEHPGFECGTVSRNPLRVSKAGDGGTKEGATAD